MSIKKRKAAKAAPKKARRRLPPKETSSQWEVENREDFYAQISHLAVRHEETDKLIRNVMAAMLARGTPGTGTILARDLTLLRWTLKKMNDNRREEAILGDAPEGPCWP